MDLTRYGKVMGEVISRAWGVFPADTLLGKVASDSACMVEAYLSDGRMFLEKDDPVNALASFAYASGWLDCGCWTGLFRCGRCFTGRDMVRAVPSVFHDRLHEKTFRYSRLLASAVLAVKPSAEAATIPAEGGVRIMMISSVLKDSGDYLAGKGNLEEALFLYSYGHGWLDAGIRAGLLVIEGDRSLFTV